MQAWATMTTLERVVTIGGSCLGDIPATDTMSQTHHLCLRFEPSPGMLTLTGCALQEGGHVSTVYRAVFCSHARVGLMLLRLLNTALLALAQSKSQHVLSQVTHLTDDRMQSRRKAALAVLMHFAREPSTSSGPDLAC